MLKLLIVRLYSASVPLHDSEVKTGELNKIQLDRYISPTESYPATKIDANFADDNLMSVSNASLSTVLGQPRTRVINLIV